MISEPTTAGNRSTERRPEPNGRKLNNGSSQLNRWSRARVIKSGRNLERPVQHKQEQNTEDVDRQFHRPETTELSPYTPSSPGDGGGGETDEAAVRVKQIYMVSDGSGRTAEHSVNAALGQFEHFMADHRRPVNTRLFSGINDIERLMEIIKQAAKEDALFIYTLADEKMSTSAQHAWKTYKLQSIDILKPVIDTISSHLGMSPSGLPRGAPGRKFPLTEEYFKRIDAIKFTIKQDDGALPQNLQTADIVVAGVSRSGKTPLSIYLAQKGFKVANVPIVKGVELPKSLFEVDPRKVVGLTLNPVMLQSIRRERAKSLGLVEDERSDYGACEGGFGLC